MSLERADIDALLEIVADFADRHLDEAHSVDLDGAAALTPLPTLAGDLRSEGGPEVLAWVAEAVETVSERSASWGFTLASRYTAQLVVPDPPEGAFMATGRIDDQAVTLPAAPLSAGDLADVLLLTDAGVVPVTDASLAPQQPHRTGLRAARLATVQGTADIEPAAATRDGDDQTSRAHVVHAVLLGAVAVGLSRSLLRDAIEYTQVREQFGAKISTFAGLRATIGSAHHASRVAHLALTAVAASGDVDAALTASAQVADAALDNAIDAVQAFGGYGYIDEYPVAARFRDAISLRARVAPAHAAWRASARTAYHPARLSFL